MQPFVCRSVFPNVWGTISQSPGESKLIMDALAQDPVRNARVGGESPESGDDRSP